MNEYIEVRSFSFLVATHFGKNALKTVKLMESKHFESLSKDKNGYVAENRS